MTVYLLIGLVALLSGLFLLLLYLKDKGFEDERTSWKEERSALLDRIQAVDYEALWTSKIFSKQKPKEEQEEPLFNEDDLSDDDFEGPKELLEEKIGGTE